MDLEQKEPRKLLQLADTIKATKQGALKKRKKRVNTNKRLLSIPVDPTLTERDRLHRLKESDGSRPVQLLPDRIEQGRFESRKTFLARLNKLALSAITEADIRDRFELDTLEPGQSTTTESGGRRTRPDGADEITTNHRKRKGKKNKFKSSDLTGDDSKLTTKSARRRAKLRARTAAAEDAEDMASEDEIFNDDYQDGDEDKYLDDDDPHHQVRSQRQLTKKERTQRNAQNMSIGLPLEPAPPPKFRNKKFVKLSNSRSPRAFVASLPRHRQKDLSDLQQEVINAYREHKKRLRSQARSQRLTSGGHGPRRPDDSDSE